MSHIPAITPLPPADTGEEALGIMNEFYVRHLPVVEGTTLRGVVSEDDASTLFGDIDVRNEIAALCKPFKPLFAIL